MSNKIFGVSFPKKTVETIDAERGDVSRSRYLLRIVESHNYLKKARTKYTKISSVASLNDEQVRSPLSESTA
jgi:hypothetical protein